MKAKLVLVIAIIISAINISYGSLDEPKTREEFEQKVEQQRAEIKKLKTKISEQEKEILELKWEIYRLKHKPEPNSIAESETKDTNTNKLQTGIDPNSEPNDISKLMTEEEQEAEERWAEYKTYLKKANQQKYKPKPKISKRVSKPKILSSSESEERREKIEKQFSWWDGSHRGLTKLIKESMNDPKSYQHVETRYVDKGDYLIVVTTFRGKNAFGGVVKNSVTAKVDLNGNVISIISQEP